MEQIKYFILLFGISSVMWGCGKEKASSELKSSINGLKLYLPDNYIKVTNLDEVNATKAKLNLENIDLYSGNTPRLAITEVLKENEENYIIIAEIYSVPPNIGKIFKSKEVTQDNFENTENTISYEKIQGNDYLRIKPPNNDNQLSREIFVTKNKEWENNLIAIYFINDISPKSFEKYRFTQNNIEYNFQGEAKKKS